MSSSQTWRGRAGGDSGWIHCYCREERRASPSFCMWQVWAAHAWSAARVRVSCHECPCVLPAQRSGLLQFSVTLLERCPALSCASPAAGGWLAGLPTWRLQLDRPTGLRPHLLAALVQDRPAAEVELCRGEEGESIQVHALAQEPTLHTICLRLPTLCLLAIMAVGTGWLPARGRRAGGRVAGAAASALHQAPSRSPDWHSPHTLLLGTLLLLLGLASAVVASAAAQREGQRLLAEAALRSCFRLTMGRKAAAGARWRGPRTAAWQPLVEARPPTAHSMIGAIRRGADRPGPGIKSTVPCCPCCVCMNHGAHD